MIKVWGGKKLTHWGQGGGARMFPPSWEHIFLGARRRG